MARKGVWEAEDWYVIWCADKESMLDTMVRNMASDLECGYNYFGNCIKRQREMIDAYKAQYGRELDMLANMETHAILRWCYFDLKKRGAIS